MLLYEAYFISLLIKDFWHHLYILIGWFGSRWYKVCTRQRSITKTSNAGILDIQHCILCQIKKTDSNILYLNVLFHNLGKSKSRCWKAVARLHSSPNYNQKRICPTKWKTESDSQVLVGWHNFEANCKRSGSRGKRGNSVNHYLRIYSCYKSNYFTLWQSNLWTNFHNRQKYHKWTTV